jgi:hypothetical protein
VVRRAVASGGDQIFEPEPRQFLWRRRTPPRQRRLQLADRFLPVDERAHTEALSIDHAAKTVRPRNLETGAETDEPYDRLLLSPGAEVARSSIPAGEPKRHQSILSIVMTAIMRWID